MQRDFLIEADDRGIALGAPTVQTVADRLPARKLLLVSDIASALDVDTSLVYAWIEAGMFPVLNLGAGPSGRPYYKVDRSEFLTWIRSRVQ